MNIKTKLSLLFTITVMVIVTVISLSVYIFTLGHRKEIYTNRLEDRCINIASVYSSNTDTFNIAQNVIIGSSSNLIDEAITIVDIKRDTAFKYYADTLKTEYTSEEINSNESYTYRVNNINNNFSVQVQAYDKYGYVRLKFLQNLLTITWVISLLVTSIASWFFVKNVLKPISSVVKQVTEINVNNLNARVDEGNGKDEIAQLAIKFNEMLIRLEESFNMQKTFVSNASHELKTPLTSITGQIEVALLSDRNINEYKELLSSVLEDTVYLNVLTQKLLDFAHININNIKIPFDKIRIDELILNIREDAIKRKADFNIKVYFESFSDLDNLLLVNGNEHLLKIAFMNLLDNAYKYSFDKTATVYFRIVDETVKVTVKDFGIGISEEELQKVSEPFYRSTSVMNIKGHGIGLSLTKRIVQLHDGKLESSSRVNHGSSFTITLPLIFN